MTGWLGVVLAATFGLVAAQRGGCRDAPGAVMAAGMAVMSLGMGGVGPTVVHGPWWAVGFAVVAVWPLVRPPRGGVCGGPLTHLLGGVAMVDMCALPAMAGASGGMTTTSASAVSSVPTATVAVPMGHHHSMGGMGAVELPGAPMTAGGPLGTALTLLGWALACYFLLATVTALTRRKPGGGAPAAPRLTVFGEAAMGLGTALMLTACA